MTKSDLITKDDLKQLEENLIDRIIDQFVKYSSRQFMWVKSSEAQRLLNCSASTLQNLRKSRRLPYSKYGGTIYYNYYDILRSIEDNLVQITPPKNEPIEKFDPDDEWEVYEKVNR
jgi:hypothetical protein